jgi:hypothetical protein
LYSGVGQLLSYQYKIPYYSVCANGFIYDPPTGYLDSINTGSAVTQNAYRIGDILHFTFDANIDTGWCGLQYGRINLSTQSAMVKSFGNAHTMLCYPAVAPFGFDDNDKSAVICYLQADTSLYPQVCAVAIDDDMQFSTPIVLRKGDTTINMLAPPAQNNMPERWGDYTGIQKKYNTTIPEVWCAGAYAGNNSRKASYNTWISQLINSTTPLAFPSTKNEYVPIQIYPNPSYQDFVLEFETKNIGNTTISVFDVQGKKVKEILNSALLQGKYKLHFNKGVLPSGMYNIIINNDTRQENIKFQVL